MGSIKNTEEKMEIDDEENTTLKPRPYQDQILNVCLQKNTIIYLPTGSGKTFIALMAMKLLAKDLDKPLSEGGKRSIFVVNTVALAIQQKMCIEEATAFKTAVYTGDMNVDVWSNDQWSEEFETYCIFSNFLPDTLACMFPALRDFIFCSL